MNSLQLTFTSMAASIGIAMDNATTNQQSCQNIANATVSVCCKAILLQLPGAKP